MPENTLTPSTPAPEATKTPRQRAEQDQQIANDIGVALELLETAQSDAEIRPLMEERGYDAEALGIGVALQLAAQKAFSARQEAMAKSEEAGAAFDGVEAAARQAYADFRETARVKFSAATERAGLGLNGAVPRDLQKFITTATTSYEAAQRPAYAAVLAKAGFKPATAAAELAALKRLSELQTKFTAAAGNAKSATTARDVAHVKLAKWMREYRRLAKLALRGKPGLLAKLGI